MRIALGCDHRGFKLKQAVMEFLQQSGYSYHDFGSYSTELVDYPDFAQKVGNAVASGEFDRGILICDTGIGMCIAANKIKGIRAALCHDTFTAKRARLHNDANILCLRGENIEVNEAREIVKTYLSTTFEGGRHIPRLNKIKVLETG
ncbi:MAG: ribose 5-phosphate isomerase B [Chloroflexi bacterium CG_4_10_14_0_8_um_filter_46_9]|nr:MAG: ribose 5-phosphate isomerase B [Dehalococcoidia bacterium CG2_30_46_19]PIW40382.1 MAG: ribose 5-phosphate isomerase B [Chloroflexi bacterium CG15_BIG_FIL_POST_REV_8_21_14_020_46_15]PIZ27164.1 MAG: ribose 5-phosphate isomerase B [Chloroflexi bacterium CG_4_10_14_0_8_um_filter_46_9]